MSRPDALYRECSLNIASFCREMNFTPTRQQAAILADVQNATLGVSPETYKRRIAVSSGQGVGKTAASVMAGLWRAFRAPDAKTFVTAPTMRQCNRVWLPEAVRRVEAANQWIRDRIKCTGSRIIIGGRPDQWGVDFFTAVKAENAQGLHNEHMTVICEEASGVSEPLMHQIEGTLKNKDYLWLAIGNPNSRSSAFYDFFTRSRHLWRTRTLDARESPVADQAKIAEQIKHFGPDSDFVRVRILGQFPHLDPDCIIDIATLEAAALKPLALYSRERRDGVPLIQFGLDFARYGADENVMAVRVGNALFHLETHKKTDPHLLIAKAFEFQRRMHWKDDEVLFVVDATGMGQGLIYDFHRAGKPVMEFHNNGTPYGPMYENKITEAYYDVRDLAVAGDLSLLDDAELFRQFSCRKYWMTKDGTIELESKDEYKKRHDDSPDRADAVAMAFYSHGLEGVRVSDGREERRGRRIVRGAA